MLSTLHVYLASLPVGGTVIVSALLAASPAVALFAAGFEACRAADCAAARSWGR